VKVNYLNAEIIRQCACSLSTVMQYLKS